MITIHTKKGEDMKTRMSHSNLVNLLCSYPGFVACSMQSSTDRRIQLKSSYKNGNIFVLTVDNTCENKVKKDKEGVFLSTKHKGNGIGVETVKNIAQRYQGVCRIELENGMFRISVMLKG